MQCISVHIFAVWVDQQPVCDYSANTKKELLGILEVRYSRLSVPWATVNGPDYRSLLISSKTIYIGADLQTFWSLLVFGNIANGFGIL